MVTKNITTQTLNVLQRNVAADYINYVHTTYRLGCTDKHGYAISNLI